MKANIRVASWRVPGLVMGSALLLLVWLAVFVARHGRQAEEFTLIVIHARPEWLALALVLQAGTYLGAGGVWSAVIRAAGHRVSLGALARFSVEKLSIDQLIPLGGVSGNLVVFQAMRRLGLPRLTAVATACGTGVFLLDAATLWAVLHLTASPVGPFTAFVALVIGSMAGTISFLPGGIGGFEAGCVLTLHLPGVPVEDALTGTLLLRGLSLWLPLVPGLFLVRRDLLRPGHLARDEQTPSAGSRGRHAGRRSRSRQPPGTRSKIF
jgi:uncharacterized membrane protein YbhN (UPF0104 family)